MKDRDTLPTAPREPGRSANDPKHHRNLRRVLLATLFLVAGVGKIGGYDSDGRLHDCAWAAERVVDRS